MRLVVEVEAVSFQQRALEFGSCVKIAIFGCHVDSSTKGLGSRVGSAKFLIELAEVIIGSYVVGMIADEAFKKHKGLIWIAAFQMLLSQSKPGECIIRIQPMKLKKRRDTIHVTEVR